MRAHIEEASIFMCTKLSVLASKAQGCISPNVYVTPRKSGMANR